MTLRMTRRSEQKQNQAQYRNRARLGSEEDAEAELSSLVSETYVSETIPSPELAKIPQIPDFQSLHEPRDKKGMSFYFIGP